MPFSVEICAATIGIVSTQVFEDPMWIVGQVWTTTSREVIGRIERMSCDEL